MSTELIDALNARNGIVCAVGAGGKKTTLYALARLHGGRVGMTCTVFMTTFSRTLNAQRLVTNAPDIAGEVAAAAADSGNVAWARPSEKSGRMAGVTPTEVEQCHKAGNFDVTLVKADGARMRALKAPSASEPVLPTNVDTVLVIVSARALGRMLDDSIAHRVDRISAVTGLQPGETITPDVLGRLISSPRGGLHNIPEQACVVPVINAVDDASMEGPSRETARIALAQTDRFDRVVLTTHQPTTRLVELVTGT